MRNMTHCSARPPLLALLFGTLLIAGQVTAAPGGRLTVVNLVESGSWDVSVAVGEDATSFQLGPRQSSGYLMLPAGDMRVTASSAGSGNIVDQVRVADFADTTLALATDPTGDVRWFRLADHNHPLDNLTLQVAHFATGPQAARLKLRQACDGQPLQGDDNILTFGYGVAPRPNLETPPVGGRFRCALEVVAADTGTVLAQTRVFDTVADAGGVFRVFIVDDGAGVATYTILQELRAPVDRVAAAPAASGLYFDPDAPGAGVALIFDGDEARALTFGFDEAGDPTWWAGRPTRAGGGITQFWLHRFTRDPDSGALFREMAGGIGVDTRTCAATAYLTPGFVADSGSLFSETGPFPQDAIALAPIACQEVGR